MASNRPSTESRDEIRKLADAMTPADRPGDYAQAMMDLGATICRPKTPDCPPARWPAIASAYASGVPRHFPAPKARRARPHRHGIAWWIERDGAVWLVRRPAKGMLGGMAALPGTEWGDERPDGSDARNGPPRLHPLHARPARHRPRTDPVGDGWWQPIDGSPRPACRRSTPRPPKPCSPEGMLLPPDPFFSGDGLDRADHLRADPAAIAALLGAAEARQLVWDNGAPAIDEQGRLRWEPIEGDPPLFLGFNDDRRAFHRLPDGNAPIDARAHFQLLSLLDAGEAPTFAAALSLANWHRRHGHCSVCGSGDRAQPRRLVAHLRRLAAPNIIRASTRS